MGVPEKNVLPVSEQAAPPPPPSRKWRKAAVALLAVLVTTAVVKTAHSFCPRSNGSHGHGYGHFGAKNKEIGGCIQVQDQSLPQSFNVTSLADHKDRIVTWLSDAVKIPTEIFDVMGPIGEDPRWEVFYEFADYLEKSFPLVHQHLTRTRVMTHALVYEWQGSDPTLKPLLITGHQDVVPVLPETRDLWTHDPYGGEFDGEKIWGRGSLDDKTGTIGSLAAVELLLESGKFQPARTVIMAYGIDEETGGKGAYHLNEWIEAKYGKDSIAMLVDEGSGVSEVLGQTFALPAVAEKGYLDVEVRVETKGGHSSVPPKHTGIGLMSLALAELERHPHKPYLNPESPLVDFTACAARYSPQTPEDLKKHVAKVTRSLEKGKVDKKALKWIEKWWTNLDQYGFLPGLGRAMVSTTQAIDIINGGVKINALPEVVTAVVNHRINIASNVGELQARMIKVLGPVAKKYGLNMVAWGNQVDVSEFKSGCKGSSRHDDDDDDDDEDNHFEYDLSASPVGTLILDTAYNSTLNPAPISPFTVESAAWRVLSQASKAVWATRPDADGTELYMAPLMSTGNTDTKRYWDLTRNIYRFAYLTGTMNNAHTVDEWCDADVFVEQVRWFMNFVVLADENKDL